MPRPLGLKQSPETRARIKAARIALMADPYERARISDAMRTACADPERKQQMRSATTIAWQDPDKAQRMGPPRAHIAALAPEQRVDYRRLQRNGFKRAEILDALGVQAG